MTVYAAYVYNVTSSTVWRAWGLGLSSPLTLLKLSTVLSVLCTRSLRAACIDLKFKIIFYCEKRKTAKFPTTAHQWVSYSWLRVSRVHAQPSCLSTQDYQHIFGLLIQDHINMTVFMIISVPVVFTQSLLTWRSAMKHEMSGTFYSRATIFWPCLLA